MALSDDSHRPWVLTQLQADTDLALIRSAVDVGAGFGGWREFMRPWFPAAREQWTAIEIHEPYVDRFLLQYRYAQVITADVRLVDPLPPADVYFFGDVIEHMPIPDAVAVWERALEVAWRLVLALPIVPYPQGESLGNPYEAHVADWSETAVRRHLTGIRPGGHDNGYTGAYIAEGQAPLGGP